MYLDMCSNSWGLDLQQMAEKIWPVNQDSITHTYTYKFKGLRGQIPAGGTGGGSQWTTPLPGFFKVT